VADKSEIFNRTPFQNTPILPILWLVYLHRNDKTLDESELFAISKIVYSSVELILAGASEILNQNEMVRGTNPGIDSRQGCDKKNAFAGHRRAT
jgi:hypothetical protein